MSDDLRRRFPYKGANFVDGLTNRLERFLKDRSTGIERSWEIHDNAWRDFLDHRRFSFNPDPNSLYCVGRSGSLTPISMQPFWSIRRNSKSQWSQSPDPGLNLGSVWFGSVIVLGLVWVFEEDGFEEIHYSLLFVPISYWCWVCVYCFCVWLTRKISCWVCVCCFCVRLTRKIYCWVCVCVSGFVIFGF